MLLIKVYNVKSIGKKGFTMFLVDLEDVWFGISKVAEAGKVR